MTEEQLRQSMKEFSCSHSDDDSYGANAAVRICDALSKDPWGHVEYYCDDKESLWWSKLSANTIVDIMTAVGDELVYGSQVETEFGTKLLSLANELKSYYDNGCGSMPNQEKVDKALCQLPTAWVDGPEAGAWEEVKTL